MPASLATVVFAAVIAGLFRLNRDPSSKTSMALWLPVIWMFIGASRMASQWLGIEPLGALDQTLEGSPFDRLFLAILLVAGLMVLAARAERVGELLRDNAVLVVFFLYCVVSVLWSDFPFVAFKRLTKGLGNLTMVLVVLSDPDPVAAIKRFLAWSGFLLIPLSVLLIKYYPALGRMYNPWTWQYVFTGVSTDKNGLGGICLLVGLTSIWHIIEERRQASEEPRRGPLIAHVIVLAMVIWLFGKADSSTAIACFLLGAAVIVMTTRFVGRDAAHVHILVAAIAASVLFCVLLPNGYTYVVEALGRNTTLTGRTDIWSDLLAMDVNPWLGRGFESFWLGERADYFAQKYYFHPNQAHNGYIEMYVNLGLVGVGFLLSLIASGYRRIVDAYHSNLGISTLRLAVFVAAVVYNITEATFKVMHPVWIVFLLAIAASTTLEGRDEDRVTA
jgi:exopolysaccharide production protein ExoQ